MNTRDEMMIPSSEEVFEELVLEKSERAKRRKAKIKEKNKSLSYINNGEDVSLPQDWKGAGAFTRRNTKWEYLKRSDRRNSRQQVQVWQEIDIDLDADDLKPFWDDDIVVDDRDVAENWALFDDPLDVLCSLFTDFPMDFAWVYGND